MKQKTKNSSFADRFDKFLEKFSPPGTDTSKKRKNYSCGLVIAWMYSLFFFMKYSVALKSLYERNSTEWILKENAVMSNFSDVFHGSLNGFWLLCILLSGTILWNYLYYRQGSKSIYLMKRLPNRWEIHKRAVVLPLLAIVVTLAAAFLMLLVCFEFYMIVTPKQCIASGQWQNIWR